jgi:hypothetical protein
MSCTEEEWQKLKSAEVYGMYAQLTKRLSDLEKVVDRFVADIKESATTTEKLRIRQQMPRIP